MSACSLQRLSVERPSSPTTQPLAHPAGRMIGIGLRARAPRGFFLPPMKGNLCGHARDCPALRTHAARKGPGTFVERAPPPGPHRKRRARQRLITRSGGTGGAAPPGTPRPPQRTGVALRGPRRGDTRRSRLSAAHEPRLGAAATNRRSAARRRIAARGCGGGTLSSHGSRAALRLPPRTAPAHLAPRRVAAQRAAG